MHIEVQWDTDLTDAIDFFRFFRRKILKNVNQ